MQRFYLALYATMPAALAAAALMHLCPPAGLPSLAQRPAWPVWALIGIWLLLSALVALALRAHALWRLPLSGASALLVSTGGLGLALGAPRAGAMLASMTALALTCALIATCIRPGREPGHGRKPARHDPAIATTGQPARHGAAQRKGHQRRPPIQAQLPFWLSGWLALESFRLAHIVATEPARSSGMTGLLLAFFVALPAATLRTWTPRTARLLWTLAALAYGGLATKAGITQWTLAATLCTLSAAAPLLKHPRP